MAANTGRNLVIKQGSTTLAGVQSKGISCNGEAVDITSDDDLGYRSFLTDAGEMALDISIDGVTKDNTLRQAMLANSDLDLANINITYPNGDTITGNFLLTSLEETGEYKGAVTFTGQLQSNGAWTYTAV